MRINIEIGDIEAFIELTETNSFAKAATNLNLSQPALSRRIQKLENELGTTLFDRTTRKVQLSYSGRNFYDRARGIIEAVKTATKTLSEKYSFPSIIKIGVVHSALRNILFSALKDLKEMKYYLCSILTDLRHFLPQLWKLQNELHHQYLYFL